jgi:hypothetical protein
MRAVGLAGLLTRLAALGAVAFGVLGGRAASADPIGPDCGTCQGSIYLLQYDPTPVATTATTQTFRITFTIDTSGYNGGGAGIDTVAVKVTNDLEPGSSLLAAPTAISNWQNYIDRGLSAGGCSGGGSGFDCDTVKIFGAMPAVGGILVWKWNLEVQTGALFTDPLEASVKVRYVDALRTTKVGDLVSEGITLQPNGNTVPEPSTLALAATGLVLLATRRRRTRRG